MKKIPKITASEMTKDHLQTLLQAHDDLISFYTFFIEHHSRPHLAWENGKMLRIFSACPLCEAVKRTIGLGCCTFCSYSLLYGVTCTEYMEEAAYSRRQATYLTVEQLRWRVERHEEMKRLLNEDIKKMEDPV